MRHLTEIPGYPAPHSPYSHAVVANGFVFVSGQIAVRPGGAPTEVAGAGMAEQTPPGAAQRQEAYAEFFPGPKPARAIARLGVEIPGVLVSIEAVALAPRSR